MEIATKDANVPTVWVYVNTTVQVGDADYLRIFANADLAHRWIEDPEGVGFEYPLITAN